MAIRVPGLALVYLIRAMVNKPYIKQTGLAIEGLHNGPIFRALWPVLDDIWGQLWGAGIRPFSMS